MHSSLDYIRFAIIFQLFHKLHFCLKEILNKILTPSTPKERKTYGEY